MAALTLSLFVIGYGFRGPGRINRIERGAVGLLRGLYGLPDQHGFWRAGIGQFDSRFGNRTGVRKPDSKLSRLDARYLVFANSSPSSGAGKSGEEIVSLVGLAGSGCVR